MAAIQARQPFAALDDTRLQKLTSMKNCQNAITASLASPSMKQPLSSPGKRSFSAASFEDNNSDSENIDPAVFSSPSKRSKNIDGAPAKASKFTLTTETTKLHSPLKATPSLAKKPLSVSVPNTTTSTPISQSRGSPKHKRVGLLKANRRYSSSPFRRVDPPSFNSTSTGLPFSIDEALKGTISGYTPKPEPVVPATSILEETPMPKSWFFEIHEDTPDQEAANLMEHSASTLDISSDDDADTRRHSEAMERGKENVPPPENFANLPASELAHSSIPTHNIPSSTASTTGSKKTRRGRKEAHPDAMLEDRTPLGDLDASEFFAEGLNADSKVIIPADVTSPQKPSGLSKVFDFSIPPSPKAKLEAAKSDKGKGKGKEVETEANVDAQSKEIYICEDEL